LPRKIEALLFDLGSTLIYFDADWQPVLTDADQALVSSLAESGLILPDEFSDLFRQQMRHYVVERETEFIEYTTARLLRGMLADHGHADVSDKVLHSALEKFFQVTESHWHTEIDAIPVLRDLKSMDYRLGMVSNAGDDGNVQRLIDRAGVRPYFDIILTSAAQGIRKPNPRIFHQALEVLEVPPSQALMVGDTLGADILGAQNAGLSSVWITRRADSPANRSHLDTIVPDVSISNLDELLPLLDQFNSRPDLD